MQCPKIEYRHLSVLKQPTFSVLPKTRLIFSGSHAQRHRKASQELSMAQERAWRTPKYLPPSVTPTLPSMVIFHAYSCFCLHRACQVWENIFNKILEFRKKLLSLSPNINHVLQKQLFSLETCSFLRWWHSKYTMLQTHILPIWFSVIDEFEYLLYARSILGIMSSPVVVNYLTSTYLLCFVNYLEQCYSHGWKVSF